LFAGADRAAEDPGSTVEVDTPRLGTDADPRIYSITGTPGIGVSADLKEESGAGTVLSEQTSSNANLEGDLFIPCAGVGASGIGSGMGTKGEAAMSHEAEFGVMETSTRGAWMPGGADAVADEAGSQ
jgi:hypothetical protein